MAFSRMFGGPNWTPGQPCRQAFYEFNDGAWTRTHSNWSSGMPFNWVPPPESESASSSDASPAAAELKEVSILSWNIDFMRILPNARMKAALAHLRSLVEGETQRSIIMLNEMVMSDLNLIQSADWIQRGYRVTDISEEYWDGDYGTCILVPRSMPVKQVFRVHYDATNMGRDALFVDIDLPQDKTFRICSTHLESLVADPPMRPDQLAQAAKFMHEAGASVLGGDLNAIQPFDKTLHLDNNLKDAYLESGGEEDAESGMTWGQMASTWQRGKFGLTRMDKMLYCGGLELIGFERFGMDVEVEDELDRQRLTAKGLEKGWVTDHLGVKADFRITVGPA